MPVGNPLLNLASRLGKNIARIVNYFLNIRRPRLLNLWQSGGGERFGRYRVNHQFKINLTQSEIDQIFGSKGGSKLLLQNIGVISIEPRRRALPSPTLPLDKFTIIIFFSSIIWRRSKLDLGWPIIFLINGFPAN